ncbi:complex I NDUFA9 subunit family protein [Hyphomicrobium sp.]|uniref:complex I NDUFA9 subunit family protein n=1 Tax=Hyphomicrobium sp. TaxID=82 RepID=UPI0025B9BA3A|nr:complex I NDUFA9 subunit family protein [Hyphomicrobium sp.]MCC7254218.1 complex I NDUFA9 subunit family protein [Hyphomicrobium sp.]
MAAQGGNNELVTIFGGSGFVGRHAVRALAKKGYRIRGACRRPDLAGFLQPMGDVGQVQPVQANLRFPDSVRRAVEGAHVVINSVGLLASGGAQTFKAVHVEGARAAACAAREAGARRFVHISAIGASATSSARYAQTKAAGEAAVLEAFPEAIILRPSIVFGPEDQFFNRFAAMARISPLLPLIGGGRTRFQPVYVGDVGEAVAYVAGGGGTPGTVYELGGPEVLSFRELLERTLEYAGRERGFISLPFWLAKLQALLTWPLPNTLRPLTVDQVRLLETDNVVSGAAIKEGRTLAALGVASPRSIGAIVPGYLERFKPKGQYSHYRG